MGLARYARGEHLKPEDYPTADALVEEWDRVEGHVRDFLSGLGDEDLVRDMEFAIGGGPTSSATLGDLMQHAALHGVHHRGQVALAAARARPRPGNFDLLLLATER